MVGEERTKGEEGARRETRHILKSKPVCGSLQLPLSFGARSFWKIKRVRKGRGLCEREHGASWNTVVTIFHGTI